MSKVINSQVGENSPDLATLRLLDIEAISTLRLGDCTLCTFCENGLYHRNLFLIFLSPETFMRELKSRSDVAFLFLRKEHSTDKIYYINLSYTTISIYGQYLLLLCIIF
jgi:hypothetical protein